MFFNHHKSRARRSQTAPTYVCQPIFLHLMMSNTAGVHLSSVLLEHHCKIEPLQVLKGDWTGVVLVKNHLKMVMLCIKMSLWVVQLGTIYICIPPEVTDKGKSTSVMLVVVSSHYMHIMTLTLTFRHFAWLHLSTAILQLLSPPSHQSQSSICTAMFDCNALHLVMSVLFVFLYPYF